MAADEMKELKLWAVTIREDILKSTHSAGNGHPGGSLSAVEYLTYLYRRELHINPQKPDDPLRDRFVLSKGHAAPVLYSVLARSGYFPPQDLLTLRQFNSYLQGHPNMNDTPGIDMSTGSLGQGVSAGVGMALGAKKKNQELNVHVLLGDGELDEGEVWEAVMFAAHHQLNHLCLAVDVNGLQLDGPTTAILDTSPLYQKFAAFGCQVIEINGHDFTELAKAFSFYHANRGQGKPTVILLHTVKGKGISYMENNVNWHGKAPNEEELTRGLFELQAAREELEEA